MNFKLVVVKRIPFIFDLRQGLNFGLCGNIFGGANICDFSLGKGQKYGLHKGMGLRFAFEGRCRGVAQFGYGFGAVAADLNGPTIGRPSLQATAKTLRQISGGVLCGFKFNTAWGVADQLQRGFHIEQKFDVAMMPDEV